MNNFYRILSSFDVQSILEFYTQIEKQIQWTQFNNAKQAGLQYKDGDTPWTSAVGKSQGQEIEYSKLNEVFANSIFESLINQYNLKRTRLMWIDGKTCYSMHSDFTPRIHMPIITNDQSFLVFKEGCVAQLHSGLVYWTDTRKQHTAMNGGEYPRLHLVGVVKE